MSTNSKVVTMWLLALLSISLVSCGSSYDPRQYHGDGKLEADQWDERGWFVKYTLTLGTVDLGRPGMQQFSMDSLPPQPFTPCLVATAKDRASAAKAGIWFDPSIRFRIHDGNGGLVCEAAGHLSTWQGALKATAATGTPDVKAPEAGVCAPRGGSSSCADFTPKSRHQYKVELEVSEPDPRARDFSVELYLSSYPK